MERLQLLFCALCLAMAGGELRASGRGNGWLPRLVAHYKRGFIEEMQQLAPIHLNASLVAPPEGYVDSTSWDGTSVARLLGLLRADERARPVRRALRRALVLAPSRRRLSKAKSYKYFPSLQQVHQNYFYYDMDSGADAGSSSENSTRDAGGALDDGAVLQIENPVEARLPSARISVGLLKSILEARAKAARVMPPRKTTPRFTWSTKDLVTTKKTSTAANTSTNTETSAATETSTANMTSEVNTAASTLSSEPATTTNGTSN